MKVHKIYLLRIMAALLFCSGIASCSYDELGIQQEKPLLPGEHPLTLTASVDGMTTRTTGKDIWSDGDLIGVRMIEKVNNYSYPDTGCYKLNADGSIQEILKPYIG